MGATNRQQKPIFVGSHAKMSAIKKLYFFEADLLIVSQRMVGKEDHDKKNEANKIHRAPPPSTKLALSPPLSLLPWSLCLSLFSLASLLLPAFYGCCRHSTTAASANGEGLRRAAPAPAGLERVDPPSPFLGSSAGKGAVDE